MPPKTDNSSKLPRRNFLARGFKVGAAALALPAFARTPSAKAPLPAPEVKPFELDELTLAALQDGMKSGKFTARSLAEKYLARIGELDTSGPALNSVIELNHEALTIADSLDAERQSKGPRGPLHGIPVLIKDNVGTADHMMTTAGSLALLGFTPAKDSGVARRLRESGALILGKTNLSEWANFRSSHSSSGWSGRGGQTHNPYAYDRSPCGSSSGSGAAVSASLCAVAVGSETDGSIVCPCSANGIVGIKPTVGLVSRAGIIPISHSQDTAGPMGRTVADAAALLGVLAAGADPDDSATKAPGRKVAGDYTKFLDRGGLRGARIGVVHKSYDFSESVASVLRAALDAMKHEGAVLVDPVEITSLGKFDDSEMDVMLYEFKHDLNAYLGSAGPNAPVRSLKEVIAFNEKYTDKELTYFGQDLFVAAEKKGPLTDKAYLDALTKNHRLARTEGIDAVMEKYRLDALVAPTAGPSWLIDLVDGDHDTGGTSSLAAVAGYPNINVPAGFVFGMPVGISFFGRAWSEPTLIKIAYAFEQATLRRKPPRFLSTVDLSSHF
ncbi:MAG TPA: amidase [Candidatus Acidoferrales bacterium]|jgi:amidase|nr:amidase [Candidatus Acidoferrales bacterium]